MKKQVLGLCMAIATVSSLTGCGAKAEGWGKDNSGSVLNIQCWNDEFRGFFNRYVSDEGKALLAQGKLMDDDAKKAKTGLHIDGTPVVFVETPNSDGQYQKAIDMALDKQFSAKAEDKVDLFLAEADYILKYADDDMTQDIKALGVKDMKQTYDYTVQAASDSKNVVKGVSFQCCPSALIYNRVVAKALFGTDDPTVVGEKLSTWEKFDAVAADAKAKGYYMTACEAETYRVFSNNASSAWVTDGKLSIPDTVQSWMDQADKYVKNGYTIAADVWSGEKSANIAADANNTLCCFGPAWYYNFCMGGSKSGDWGIVEGPMAHFWGGTWLMAAAGSDNTDLVAKVMNAFINDETVLNNLIKNEGQFTNNKKVNQAAADAGRSNAFLGGQNDTKLFCDLAKNIKFKNATIYDQYCNEGLQKYFREYLDGDVSKEKAIANFKSYIKEQFPDVAV